jgi:hypothetical protein
MNVWGHIADEVTDVYSRMVCLTKEEELIAVKTGRRGTGLYRGPAANSAKLPSLEKRKRPTTSSTTVLYEINKHWKSSLRRRFG